MLKSLLDILFPPLCHVCREYVAEAGALHLCGRCLGSTRFISSPLCRICGIPFATEEGIDHLCGDCMDSPPPFDAARAAALFEGPVQDLVHRLKYGNKVHLRRPLALLMLERLAPFLEDASPDLILPVPLHRRRLAARGFNQAVLIADFIGRRRNIPLERFALRRVRWTEPQVNLPAAERMRNVRGAFDVEAAAVKGKRVLLLDDVYTTGSTLRECARVVKKAGAAAVFAVTAARAR